MKNLIRYFVVVLALFAGHVGATAQDAKSKELTAYFTSSMDCHECELKLTEWLKFEKGVRDLKVDFSSNTIKIVYKPTKNSPENLAKKIEKSGYDAIPISEKEYSNLTREMEKK